MSKYPKYYKDDKFIYYNLIKTNEYPFLCECRDKAVHINVRPNYDPEEINRFLFKQFDHFYQMINDLEFAQKCGNNASKIVEEMSVEKIADKWIEVIESV